MQITPVTLNVGLQGIKRANAGIHEAASELVHHASRIDQRGASELAAPLVALKSNTLLFEASGKVIKIANENTGSLIDALV